MKILLFTESYILPHDEGFRKLIYHTGNSLSKHSELLFVSPQSHLLLKNNRCLTTNKLLLSFNLFLIIKQFMPDIILYIPAASCTFNSLVRGKILRFMKSNAKIAILACQKRTYSFFQKTLLPFFLPDLLFSLSNISKSSFAKLPVKITALPPAIDPSKFHAIPNIHKDQLRRKYSIPVDKVIVTHIGHIKSNRNLNCFLDVQNIDNFQVVIVGSTSTQTNQQLKELLANHGIIIIDDYIPNIQEIYHLSDIYVFPVNEANAAIETPLSIIEAMACNLPVITTPFGSLVDYFFEDSGFKYFNTTEELIELIKTLSTDNITNYKKIKHFTWERFANEIISACKKLS